MTAPRWLALLAAAIVLVAVVALPRGVATVVVAVGVVALLAIVVRAPARESEPAPLPAVPLPRAPLEPDPGEPLFAVLDPLPSGVALLDDELTVLAANPAFARLVGHPLDGMIGASLIRATRDYDLITAARARPAEAREIQMADGQQVLVAVAPLDPPLLGGRVSLMLCVEDVTALHEAQRARTDLVANLSHELRTPIAGARAIAETLQTAHDDPAGRERFLGLLNEELERMSELVQRMLRLAQLESEREPLELETVSPVSLIESAAERFGPVAARREVRIEVEAVAPDAVRANPARAGEVLANLLDNALRHSPPGSRVTLAALAALADDDVDGGADGDAVRFEVRDEGPGILPRERDRVFERFYTGDSAREAGSHTGLGLAIARRLVLQQGGRIWVADRAPGATLCFTLARADGVDAAEG